MVSHVDVCCCLRLTMKSECGRRRGSGEKKLEFIHLMLRARLTYFSPRSLKCIHIRYSFHMSEPCRRERSDANENEKFRMIQTKRAQIRAGRRRNEMILECNRWERFNALSLEKLCLDLWLKFLAAECLVRGRPPVSCERLFTPLIVLFFSSMTWTLHMPLSHHSLIHAVCWHSRN